MSLRLLVLSIALGLAAQSEAGVFKKSPKPDPSVHVPELLEKLRTHKDEKVRVESASELRDFDGKEFPGILNALTEALNTEYTVRVYGRKLPNRLGRSVPSPPRPGMLSSRRLPMTSRRWSGCRPAWPWLEYRFLGYFSGVSKVDETVAQSSEPPLVASGIKGTAEQSLVEADTTPGRSTA